MAVKAGAVYFALIFALGFLFGVLRDFVFQAGATEDVRIYAALFELPVMLAASWMVCGILVRRFHVPAVMTERAIMGITAFALLMIAEIGMSVFLLDRPLSAHFSLYGQFSYALGLAAQIFFAAFPLLNAATAAPGAH